MAGAIRKKPRKSRGRGLRTTTGCLTCRKRHKKCDERIPICGACQVANRTCVYAQPGHAAGNRSGVSGPMSGNIDNASDGSAGLGSIKADEARSGPVAGSSSPSQQASHPSIPHHQPRPNRRQPDACLDGSPHQSFEAAATQNLSTSPTVIVTADETPEQLFASRADLAAGPSPVSPPPPIHPANFVGEGVVCKDNLRPSDSLFCASDDNDNRGIDKSTGNKSNPNNSSNSNNKNNNAGLASRRGMSSIDLDGADEGALDASSPGAMSLASDILLTSGGASIGWLDLLASDAAQADASFSLLPFPSPRPGPQGEPRRTSISVRAGSFQDGLHQDDNISPSTTAEQQLRNEDSWFNQRYSLQQQYQIYLQQQQQQQRQYQSNEQQQDRKDQQDQQQSGRNDPEWTNAAFAPQQALTDGNKHPWQQDQDIPLQEHERVLFRNFVEHAASWLDFSDPHKYFSTYAIRLALRNMGLMKAVLALSARHTAMSQGNPASPTQSQASVQRPDSDLPRECPPPEGGHDPKSTAQTTTSFQDPQALRQQYPDVTAQHAQAIQYYYETLHYLQHALQFPSYTMSEEILATAIIISTYEMLDQSASNWQRHLKGVFWIQRSQNVNGASGGLRQTVWWAWLRQDIWAAFRERRACFTIYKPERELAELRGCDDELVDRVLYLLSQAVNYAASSHATSYASTAVPSRDPVGADATPHQQRLSADERWRQRYAAKALLSTLERWRSYLGPQFQPLPTPRTGTAMERTMGLGPLDDFPFAPIWIHPPRCAVAMMVYHFAKILVTLHCPMEPGFAHHLKVQKTLSESVAAICGIAMMLDDEGCQIMASQCLYGAGLCVHQPDQRSAVLQLITACERRTGWPMSTMRRDLQAEWERANKELG
ncbi:hypothetical protein VTK73DRAFT_8629 [Phialemonium thermophilum]|uniref:Zn(2)-C6 fungal-type domain-containing protein n=1 Tax=Phialemonium thermophilum TaxID=223376 RepID=A0ABR3W7Z0_9PEZI